MIEGDKTGKAEDILIFIDEIQVYSSCLITIIDAENYGAWRNNKPTI